MVEINLPHRTIPSLETSQENWESLLTQLEDYIIAVAPGGGVGTDATYVHNQTSSSSTWTINHNLGKFPCIEVVDSTGRNVEGDYTWSSANSITATFSSAFTGVAYIN